MVSVPLPYAVLLEQGSPKARFSLRDGNSMPVVGLGVYRMKPGSETHDAVACALEYGYRMVDTAAAYSNEADVGDAVRKSPLQRNDVFITTKLWHDGLGYSGCIQACERSLEALGTDYIDLYLIHSPQEIIETWDAMIEVQRRGWVRSIGVSNFSVAHLEVLASHSPQHLPVVNQIEMHPLIWRERHDVLEWCRMHGILVTAYGSLFSGQQERIHRAVGNLAAEKGKAGTQILLRWAHQMGFAIIPKSLNADRIRDNARIFDFQLSDRDMSNLCNLKQECLNEYWNPLEWKANLQNDTDKVIEICSNTRLGLPKTWAEQSKEKRSSACIALAEEVGVTGALLEKAVRQVQWPERRLEWQHSKTLTGIPCAFAANDLFPESSRSNQKMLPWLWLGGTAAPMDERGGSLLICVSADRCEDEDDERFAMLLTERLKTHFETAEERPLRGAKVVLVSTANRIPFLPLPQGLASLHVSKQDITVNTGCNLLDEAGMFVIPSVLKAEEVATLHSLVIDRIQDAEQALQAEGEDIGSGDFQYREIVQRGKHRWDMSLYKHNEAIGPGDAANDHRLDVLKRIGGSAIWLPILETLLGEVKWEAGCVCSRPGASGQGWHADASPSKHSFGGETGVAPGVCVFIPLVPLRQPTFGADGEVKHGFGCTAFWPGSHRYRECAFLGAAAARHLEAAVLGAPLDAGDALVYDMRVVHSGSPNDAFHLTGIEGYRPILQLSYFPQRSRMENELGYYQLYCD